MKQFITVLVALVAIAAFSCGTQEEISANDQQIEPSQSEDQIKFHTIDEALSSDENPNTYIINANRCLAYSGRGCIEGHEFGMLECYYYLDPNTGHSWCSCHCYTSSHPHLE